MENNLLKNLLSTGDVNRLELYSADNLKDFVSKSFDDSGSLSFHDRLQSECAENDAFDQTKKDKSAKNKDPDKFDEVSSKTDKTEIKKDQKIEEDKSGKIVLENHKNEPIREVEIFNQLKPLPLDKEVLVKTEDLDNKAIEEALESFLSLESKTPKLAGARELTVTKPLDHKDTLLFNTAKIAVNKLGLKKGVVPSDQKKTSGDARIKTQSLPKDTESLVNLKLESKEVNKNTVVKAPIDPKKNKVAEVLEDKKAELKKVS